ncbi:Branched-chain amino acid ABC transporter substrate-binding protein [Frankia canadensis]|uniref:Branched-chain amino acid ABC transporter substrate-binding protein n=1 Tax=Frankia canadensis TaxID=1836972 RepID=A0A2I2KQ76_9ACTN|nr:ABC transporter substrate-binding protein [Frankia canadensis]SNQ47814.1 Branched-chain amino acid ABC transporter substrate-binding protein [Frankia canadensis]SOU55104.1 Branched-chain amino acid ABC transporter substrate-binding protein [Frankia canadensis]
MGHRWRALVAAAALGWTAATLAACGTSPSTADVAGSRRCAATASVTDTAINLGLLYSGSGVGADPSIQFRAGVDARLDEQNAQGGINGRHVAYDLQNDESRPEMNLVVGRRLAEEKQVLSILQFSVAPTGAADLLDKAGIATVEGVVPNPVNHSNVFSYSRPLSQQPPSSNWGEFIAQHGGRRALTVSVEFSEATQALAGFAAQSLRAAGINVVGTLQAPGSGFDTAAFGARIRATGADSIIAFVPASIFYQMVAGARAAGVNLTVALGNIATYDPTALAGVGAAAAGAYSFLDYAPFEIDSPAHRRFQTAMNLYSPQAAGHPQGVSLIGWISADLLLRGLEAAGPCPTRQTVLDGLRSVQNYNADGLLPAPISLRSGIGAIAPCYDYVQVNQAGTGFDVVRPAPQCGRILS